MSIIKNHDDKHHREELIRVLSEYDEQNHGLIHDAIYWDKFETEFLEQCYKVAMDKTHGVKVT